MKVDNVDEIKRFLQDNKEFYSDIDTRKTELEKELNIKELETIDLLHEIEIASLSAIEQMKVFRQLKQVRKKRREIKDKLELMHYLKQFSNKFITKGICAELNIVIENIKLYENELRTRTYKPKALKDLKCAKKEKKQNEMS